MTTKNDSSLNLNNSNENKMILNSKLNNHKKSNVDNITKPTFNSDSIFTKLNMNSNKKDKINLNDAIYHLDNLKYQVDKKQTGVNFLSEIIKNVPEDDSNDFSILLFDLSMNNKSSGVESLKNCNSHINIVHLPLPSTLVKRPSFGFENLLKTTISDCHKKSELIELIRNSHTIFIYDGISCIENCFLSTYWFMKKLNDFYINLGNEEELDLDTKQNINLPHNEALDLYLLSSSSLEMNKEHNPTRPIFGESNKSHPTDNNTPVKNRLRNTNFNLTIKIPPNSTPTDKTSMFVSSIKKDAIHYSPKSLEKYFKFDIPKILLEKENKDSLPVWLQPYLNIGAENLTDETPVLEKILHKFEDLERLENERLENCLNYTKSKDTKTNGVKSISTNDKNQGQLTEPSSKQKQRHNIYSLPFLQKQFKKQRKELEYKPSLYKLQPPLKTNSKSLLVPKINTNSNYSPLTTNNKTDSPTTNSDSDSLTTPLDFYEISQGIQSFTRNRYSNILPYEHTRVKLQPSPINGNNPIVFSNKLKSSVTEAKSTNGNNAKENSEVSYFDGVKENYKLHDDLDIEGEEFNDYFNANYLKLHQINPDFEYIATQAPLPSTIDDFWKVVISNKIKVIVSLLSNDELNLRKWHIYWSNSSMKKHVVMCEDTYENVCDIDGCILRIFNVKKQTFLTSNEKTNVVGSEPEQVVYQIQYTKWLDSCGVDMTTILKLYHLKNALAKDAISVLSDIKTGNISSYNDIYSKCFQEIMLKQIDTNNPPILVHCSAGCGRTGVFITLDYMMNILTVVNSTEHNNNKIDVWNMKEDLIFIVVNELRKQRISMVQNFTQYLTCYESILQYFSLILEHKSSHL